MALNEVANKLVSFYQKLEAEKLNQERFYIKARLEEKISQIEKAIIPLETQKGQSEKEKQCLADIKQGLKRFKQLAGKLEEKFSIFIIGDGNVGKSTVVNTLLGAEIAKMKFDPMTWKIDVFHEADDKGVQVVTYGSKGNEQLSLTEEEAKNFIEAEEEKREASIRKIQECIKEKTDTISKVCKAQHIPFREVADKLEAYKQRLWAEELYTSPIIEARWQVPTNELLANFQVVDTPGLRQNRVASYLQDSIQKYYDEADGIIWVLDINKIATNSIKTYIEEIEKTLFTKGKAKDQKRILALLNRSDCIRTEEERQATLMQANQMYGESFNAILPFSATKALEGRLKEDKVLLQESGYEALEDYIKSYFLLGANQAKTQKILKEIQREEIKFQVLIAYYIQEMEERVRGYLAINKEISQQFKIIEKESLEQLDNMILSYGHTSKAHIEKFTEALIETKADKESLLKEDILNITRYQREVKELLQDISKKIERIQKEYMNKSGLLEVKVYPLHEVTEEFNVMQYFGFIEMALGLDKMESSPIRKLLGGISAVKKIVDKPYIEQYKERLEEQLQDAIQMMARQLTETITTSLTSEKRQILEIRQRQFDELYGNDQVRINQLYALKIIEKLIVEPTRESTVTDYIKGMGESEWNNILIS
ncbi:MAG: hypothetical protein E7231_08965 [Cellulosilyticum sp.]|nr:hypothetical protein [Cellulosilyticum sp.]